MFTIKLALAALTALFAVGVDASPAGLASRSDWKDQYGWDGKVVTPAEMDPSNALEPALGKRALNGGVYFCDNVNFWEPCTYMRGFGAEQCVNLSPEWNDIMSSFGPDPGLKCSIYRESGCSGQKITDIVNPGIKNLDNFGMNDAVSTFRCTQA